MFSGFNPHIALRGSDIRMTHQRRDVKRVITGFAKSSAESIPEIPPSEIGDPRISTCPSQALFAINKRPFCFGIDEQIIVRPLAHAQPQKDRTYVVVHRHFARSAMRLSLQDDDHIASEITVLRL